MKQRIMCVCFIVSSAIHFVLTQELYGASVHWMPTSNYLIKMTYHMIWQERGELKNLIAACQHYNTFIQNSLCKRAIEEKFNEGFVSTQDTRITPKVFPGYRWVCFEGCMLPGHVLSNLSQLYFTEVSSFFNLSWSSGIETVDIHFGATNNSQNIRFGFTYPNGSLVDGLDEAHLSMAVRNDTGRPNISPVVNVFPIYRVPIGCTISIPLFPFDGDGDRVRCHWQSFPATGYPSTGAVLNSETCKLEYTADSNNVMEGDAFFLSLYAEDYSDNVVELTGALRYLTKGPFCKTPLKVRVSIGHATTSCEENGPSFIRGNSLPPDFKYSYLNDVLRTGITTQLAFSADGENSTLMTTGPRLMTFATFVDNTSVTKFGEWSNTLDESMKGIHQACAMAYGEDGTPGESRCAIILLFEPDECSGPINPCGTEGICGNFFEHFTCVYPDKILYFNRTELELTEIVNERQPTWIIWLPIGLWFVLLIILVFLLCIWKWKYSNRRSKANSTATPIQPLSILG